MQGQAGLTTDTLDRIAGELEMRVEKRSEKKTPAGTPGTGSLLFSREKRILANRRKLRGVIA
jgi:hypothetical protein